MLEPATSSAIPDPPPFEVRAGTGPIGADPMSVTATVTDLSGDPILTVTLSVRPGGGEPPTVIAAGDVDLDTAPLLHAALITAVDRHRRVRCDLSGVTFFSAAGVSALLAGRRRAGENGSRLEVRGAHGITRRVLEITGLETLLGGQTWPGGKADTRWGPCTAALPPH
jgi:anti-anti-sigma factor